MISTDTIFQISLAAGVTLAAFLVVSTWRLANYLRDMRDEVAAIRRQMESVWTVNDMERWAIRLERENSRRPIAVPDPLEVKGEAKS